MKKQIHPETGAELHRDRRPKIVTFGSLSRTVEVDGWYPDGDGDSIHTGAELAEVDKVWRELKAEYAGYIRSLRKRWKLTQEQAGLLFGGGKRAFQKYESGKAVPSDAAVALIEMVNASPENLTVLRNIRDGIRFRSVGHDLNKRGKIIRARSTSVSKGTRKSEGSSHTKGRAALLTG